MKKCPHCKKNIDKEATKCPYCTGDLIIAEHPVLTLTLVGLGTAGIGIWLVWIPFIGIPLIIIGLLLFGFGLLGLLAKIIGAVSKPFINKNKELHGKSKFWKWAMTPSIKYNKKTKKWEKTKKLSE